MRKITSLLVALTLAAATPLGAATLTVDESATREGNFSSHFDQPTVIAANVGTVLGGQNSARDVDFLKFDGVANGAERLDFSITNPLGNWGSFNLRIKQEPFGDAHDWWPIVFHTGGTVTDGKPMEFSFLLGDHTGPLYIAFDFYDADFWSGNGLRYSITQSGAGLSPSGVRDEGPQLSAIPLPPAGALLLAGLGAFGVLRRRKRG